MPLPCLSPIPSVPGGETIAARHRRSTVECDHIARAEQARYTGASKLFLSVPAGLDGRDNGSRDHAARIPNSGNGDVGLIRGNAPITSRP